MSELRLGDIIDDYCTRCKMLTNHAIVSLVNEEPVKVHCRTCFFEHHYRRGEPPPKKKPSSKAKLFDDVLSKISGKPEEGKSGE